jgi:hypothetical protein
VKSLENDYIVLALGGRKTARERLLRRIRRRYPRLFKRLQSIRQIIRRPWPGGGGREKEKQRWAAVFDSGEALCRYLRALKEAGDGRSVVVSGLFDRLEDCFSQLDLRPHTVQFSLGCFGKKALLPDAGVLDVTTMCGHHMVSPAYVKHLSDKIRQGKMTPEEAAEAMSGICLCRIFNQPRASKLMKTLAEGS